MSLSLTMYVQGAMSVPDMPMLILFLRNRPVLADERARCALVAAILDSIARLSRQDPANRRLLTDPTADPQLYSQFWERFVQLAQQSVEDGNCSHKMLQAMQSLCRCDEQWVISSADKVRETEAMVREEKNQLETEVQTLTGDKDQLRVEAQALRNDKEVLTAEVQRLTADK